MSNRRASGGKASKKAAKKAVARTSAKKPVKASAKKSSAKQVGKKKAAKPTAKKGAGKARAKKPSAPAPVVPVHTAGEMREIVERYIGAYNARDADSILALYDPRATMEDPIGLPPAVGHAAIRGLYQMGFDMNVSIAHDGAVRCAPNTVAFPLIASSPSSRLEVVDVFEFGGNGKIVRMRAYWGPDNLQGDLAVRQ